MNPLEKFEKFNSEIKELNELIIQKKQERIDWSRENSKEVKKLYPKKGKLYQITDLKTALSSFYYYTYEHYDLDDVYYFRTNEMSRFSPHRDFDTSYGDEMPTIRGEILNSNLKVIEESERIYINYLKEIESDKSPKKMGNRVTKVYIMIDKKTGYYKIGKSKVPLTAEKTLQKKTPTVEIFHVYDAINKDEKELHEQFNDKRVIEDWFDLSGSDLEKIKEYFNNRELEVS